MFQRYFGLETHERGVILFFVAFLAVIVFEITALTPNKIETKNEPLVQENVEVEQGLEIGNRAPEFIFSDIYNNSVELSKIIGNKGLVLNAWSSVYPPYQFESQEILRIYNRFQDNFNFISIGFIPVDYKERIEEDVKKNAYQWVFASSQGEGVSHFINNYHLAQFGVTYIIDKNGIIRYKDTYITPGAVFEKELEKIQNIQ